MVNNEILILLVCGFISTINDGEEIQEISIRYTYLSNGKITRVPEIEALLWPARMRIKLCSPHTLPIHFCVSTRC